MDRYREGQIQRRTDRIEKDKYRKGKIQRKTDTEKEMYREGQIKSVGVFGR